MSFTKRRKQGPYNAQHSDPDHPDGIAKAKVAHIRKGLRETDAAGRHAPIVERPGFVKGAKVAPPKPSAAAAKRARKRSASAARKAAEG